jgi:hypothetical protein
MEAGRESVDGTTRCMDCGDVIGVYEPLVHVFEDISRRTSIAAEPGLGGAAGEFYHAGCYERRFPSG